MAAIGVDAIQVAPGGKGHARSERFLTEALAAEGRHGIVAFVRREGAGLVAGARVEEIGDPLFLVWQQWGMPRAARRLGLDAVVTLTDRLPLWGGVRFVVWLFELPTHRMGGVRSPWQRGSDLFTSALWRPSLRRAARVVAGSRATADEIEAALPELRGRVPVIYPGLDPLFGPRPGTVPGHGPGGRYVFHLGSADPRDNLDVVLEAFRQAQARLGEPLRLVVGGAVGRRLDGAELIGYVADHELPGWYSGAAVYLDATLYEGFGYQPLEAMACGAPVVASSAFSIPEVVGEAGLLCDPRSPEDLSDALVRVLQEPGLGATLRERGLARAAQFTWERTGREFADLLDEAVR